MSVPMYTIKVTNLESHWVCEHKQVPMDHIEMLRLNPNLEVEILEIDMKKASRNRNVQKDN